MNKKYITDYGVNVNRELLYTVTDELKSDISDKMTQSLHIGTQIITPKRIDTTIHDQLPLLWLTIKNPLRSWKVHNEQNSYLVVTNLENGSTEVVHTYTSKKNKRLPRFLGRSNIGEAPNKDQNGQFSLQVEEFNVKNISSLTWAKGRYALTMLTYDWRSNTEIIELLNSKNKSTSKLRIGRENQFSLLLEKNNSGQITSNTITALSSQESIIRIPATVNRDKEKLNGTLEIPINNSSLYTVSKQADHAEQHYLAATLIITQLDDFHPYTFYIKIPIDNLENVNKKTMKLTFELNMAAFFSDMPDVKIQTSQVYLVVGSQLIGPQALIVK